MKKYLILLFIAPILIFAACTEDNGVDSNAKSWSNVESIVYSDYVSAMFNDTIKHFDVVQMVGKVLGTSNYTNNENTTADDYVFAAYKSGNNAVPCNFSYINAMSLSILKDTYPIRYFYDFEKEYFAYDSPLIWKFQYKNNSKVYQDTINECRDFGNFSVSTSQINTNDSLLISWDKYNISDTVMLVAKWYYFSGNILYSSRPAVIYKFPDSGNLLLRKTDFSYMNIDSAATYLSINLVKANYKYSQNDSLRVLTYCFVEKPMIFSIVGNKTLKTAYGKDVANSNMATQMIMKQFYRRLGRDLVR